MSLGVPARVRRRGRARAVVTVTLAHAALLVVPPLLVGRAASLARAEAAAIVVLLLAFAAIEAGSLRRPDPSRFGAPGTRLALASALALLATAWLALGSPSLSPRAAFRGVSWEPWIGAALAAAGIALRASAIRALGDAFTSETVAAPGRARVTTGPYALLRHPSEVGLVLVAVGVAALGASAPAGGACALLVLTSIARVRAEDRAHRAVRAATWVCSEP